MNVINFEPLALFIMCTMAAYAQSISNDILRTVPMQNVAHGNNLVNGGCTKENVFGSGSVETFVIETNRMHASCISFRHDSDTVHAQYQDLKRAANMIGAAMKSDGTNRTALLDAAENICDRLLWRGEPFTLYAVAHKARIYHARGFPIRALELLSPYWVRLQKVSTSGGWHRHEMTQSPEYFASIVLAEIHEQRGLKSVRLKAENEARHSLTNTTIP